MAATAFCANQAIGAVQGVTAITGDGADLHSVDGGLDGGDDDAVSGLETGADHHLVATGANHLDAAEAEPVVAVGDQQLVGSAHRGARHLDDAFGLAPEDLRLDEEADGQRRAIAGAAVGIFDPRDHVDHAGLGVDLPLGPHHLSLPGVLGPREVRAQLDGRPLAFGAVVAVPEREIQEGELIVRDGEADFCEVGGVEPRHRRAAVHELTDVGGALADASRKGRANLGALQVPLRLLEVGAGLTPRRAGDPLRGDRHVELRWAGDLLFGKVLLPLELLGLALQLALGPRQVGPRELEGDLIVARVDAHQRFVLFEESTGGEGGGYPEDGARHLRDQVALCARRDGAVGCDPELDLLWRGVDDADQPRQRLRCVGFDVRARGHQGDGAEHAGDHDRDGQQELETAFHGAEYRNRHCAGQILAAPRFRPS